MISTREIDLRKLNSATKYPSIPTYHALGEKGKLLPETVSFAGQAIVATEKVDGTNSRIIVMPDGCYLIGSREELLHGSGDLIHNPALGIVDAIRGVADRVRTQNEPAAETIMTIHLETYGGRTTAAARQYTGNRETGYRLFDVSRVHVGELDKDLEQISTWRENGGQTFLGEESLADFAAAIDVKLTPRVPLAADLPESISATYEWLKRHMPKTLVALDEQAGGQPEGLVVRTMNRSTIAKIRFEDYARHAKGAK